MASQTFPDSKAHGANMGPTRVLSAPGGPHVGSMKLAFRVSYLPFGIFNYISKWVYDIANNKQTLKWLYHTTNLSVGKTASM